MGFESRTPRNGRAGQNAARGGRSPSLFDFVTEAPRVMLEASMLAASWQALRFSAPKGDAHPVMVLPGFMGGDGSTLFLRRFLDGLGYITLPWLQGQNIGRMELLEGAMRRFYRAHQSYGSKISLIGQSLGGVFARKIAQQFPDATRCVITLGSPFAAMSEEVAHPIVSQLFETMSGSTVEELRSRQEALQAAEPLPMPTTAIFSRRDGVVDWRACIEAPSSLSENVEVRGSHTGMAMAPDVLHIVADRLAQDPSCWQPFDRRQGCRSWYYPPAAGHKQQAEQGA